MEAMEPLEGPTGTVEFFQVCVCVAVCVAVCLVPTFIPCVSAQLFAMAEDEMSAGIMWSTQGVARAYA